MQPAEAHNNSEFLETYEVKKTVEELLQCPYWIIDILPSQVPEDSPGQFFSVEEYFLQGDRIEEIKQKHIDLILKLNCYRDISIGDETVINPAPMMALFRRNTLCIARKSDEIRARFFRKMPQAYCAVLPE